VAITVGFDLDMTLIDPRPGMIAVMKALSDETGVALDGEYFAANLGPPLDQGLHACGAPEDRIDELVARYRELYPDIVVPQTIALPGAEAALKAVHGVGGRTLIVTGKYGPNAALHVGALGFEVDVLVGELWSTGKARALTEHGAVAYVGDHVGDVVGALAAGAVPIGVPTGPCTRDDLLDAGAAVVFGSLADFPDWLATAAASLRAPGRSGPAAAPAG
jgi:phosphoglycolate phosphatase